MKPEHSDYFQGKTIYRFDLLIPSCNGADPKQERRISIKINYNIYCLIYRNSYLKFFYKKALNPNLISKINLNWFINKKQ